MQTRQQLQGFHHAKHVGTVHSMRVLCLFCTPPLRKGKAFYPGHGRRCWRSLWDKPGQFLCHANPASSQSSCILPHRQPGVTPLTLMEWHHFTPGLNLTPGFSLPYFFLMRTWEPLMNAIPGTGCIVRHCLEQEASCRAQKAPQSHSSSPLLPWLGSGGELVIIFH